VALQVLKYFIPGYPEQYQYCGYANVAGNVSLMLSGHKLNPRRLFEPDDHD